METGNFKESPSKGERAPILETQVIKSKDGRWLIHKTIITDIKPVRYFEKVLGPSSAQPEDEH